MSSMFQWARSYNQQVSFDTSSVERVRVNWFDVCNDEPGSDMFYPPYHHQMDYMFNLAWAFNQPVNLDTVKVARVREYLCIDFNCNYKPVTDCTVTRLTIRWTSCFGVH